MKMRLENSMRRLTYLTVYLCMLAAYVYVMMYNYIMKAIDFLGYGWFKRAFADHPMAIYIYNLEGVKKKRTLWYKFRFFDIFINRLGWLYLHMQSNGDCIFKVELLNNRSYLSRHVFWMDIIVNDDRGIFYPKRSNIISKPVFLMVTFEGVDITNFFNSIYDSFHLARKNYSVLEIVGIMKLDGLISVHKNPNVLKIECVVDDVNLSEIEYTDIIVGK